MATGCLERQLRALPFLHRFDVDWRLGSSFIAWPSNPFPIIFYAFFFPPCFLPPLLPGDGWLVLWHPCESPPSAHREGGGGWASYVAAIDGSNSCPHAALRIVFPVPVRRGETCGPSLPLAAEERNILRHCTLSPASVAWSLWSP
ncbi:uncharacterized protein Tco025E_02859 [Trypanosoma conorhini]|uniref:Uncharacterized protein n=1 Tax=Trypanosoma conorhini TaxID=83891 RepID=A0A422Q1J0_9TRYP|nr:uncharacterized protein Tco025E_02859 [Trypanosoma conorhini]RNF23637.1 hypothetical protein Tco025E_02859 [Trypanosoma conorhini]